MLTAAVVAGGTLLYGTLIGYGTHWVLHQPWAGRVHRAHLNHHLKQYPPDDLVSETYRSAGKDDSLFAFLPAVGGGLVLWCVFLQAVFGIPWWGLMLVLIESALVGWVHEYIHEGFHLEGFWLLRFSWYAQLRELHWVHHSNMRRNLGIMWFGWDRLFGTFREPTH